MLDAGEPLKQAYYDRLNGAITGILNPDGTERDEAIPVYDSAAVPAEATPPYVLISSFFSSEVGEGTKDTYGQSLSQLVDIVTEYGNSFGGKKIANQIANKVKLLIRTRSGNYVDMGSDWNMITTIVESDDTQENMQVDRMVVRRLIRFNHLVEQLTNNN